MQSQFIWPVQFWIPIWGFQWTPLSRRLRPNPIKSMDVSKPCPTLATPRNASARVSRLAVLYDSKMQKCYRIFTLNVTIIIQCEILCNLMILLKYVYIITKYSLKWRRCEDNATMHGHCQRNYHAATTFNWTTFNCWFETSSDKLQTVSSSMSAVLRQSV